MIMPSPLISSIGLSLNAKAQTGLFVPFLPPISEATPNRVATMNSGSKA
jgi:hypothetical protein